MSMSPCPSFSPLRRLFVTSKRSCFPSTCWWWLSLPGGWVLPRDLDHMSEMGRRLWLILEAEEQIWGEVCVLTAERLVSQRPEDIKGREDVRLITSRVVFYWNSAEKQNINLWRSQSRLLVAWQTRTGAKRSFLHPCRTLVKFNCSEK